MNSDQGRQLLKSLQSLYSAPVSPGIRFWCFAVFLHRYNITSPETSLPSFVFRKTSLSLELYEMATSLVVLAFFFIVRPHQNVRLALEDMLMKMTMAWDNGKPDSDCRKTVLGALNSGVLAFLCCLGGLLLTSCDLGMKNTTGYLSRFRKWPCRVLLPLCAFISEISFITSHSPMVRATKNNIMEELF